LVRVLIVRAGLPRIRAREEVRAGPRPSFPGGAAASHPAFSWQPVRAAASAV